MAGSYNHVVEAETGKLCEPDAPLSSYGVENLGDAYEAIEEMYGMIWVLAIGIAEARGNKPADLVEWARKNYEVGLTADVQRKLEEQNG